jgi:ubiquinone/menaquinone biosynthesis C-methylase UbiE
MEELDLLIDLHLTGNRQGPGSDVDTRRAIALAGLSPDPGLTIADIGCGTGAAALVLARDLQARVTAVDFLPEFLTELDRRSTAAGLSDRITSCAASMEALPFAEGSFDAIWSEGAIYSMGFAAGIRSWRRFLKPGGILALSELTWLTTRRPAEIEAHWHREYPEVATASAKLAILEAEGYSPLGYFVLPRTSWLEEYYRPMQARFPGFLDRHDQSPAAQALVDAEQVEIRLYETYSEFVSYGYYIARRLPE